MHLQGDALRHVVDVNLPCRATRLQLLIELAGSAHHMHEALPEVGAHEMCNSALALPQKARGRRLNRHPT